MCMLPLPAHAVGVPTMIVERMMTKPRGVSFEKMEQAILEAAAELFDRKGFNQTTLQDIADAIGMARPSLYHYFDNREQILAAGIDLLTKQRDVITEGLRELDGDPLQRLTALMLGLGKLISEHPVWVRIALRDEAALPADARARDRESRLAYFELLVRNPEGGLQIKATCACTMSGPPH